MRVHPWLGCLAGALLLASGQAAWARKMQVMSSTPAAQAIMQGGNAQYVVRFDGPVDHGQSRLEILRDGQVVATLHPRLDSAPDVLFASAPGLQAGHYALHWTVNSMQDREVTEGMIPFSVGQ